VGIELVEAEINREAEGRRRHRYVSNGRKEDEERQPEKMTTHGGKRRGRKEAEKGRGGKGDRIHRS
jgi:hypothetical protein